MADKNSNFRGTVNLLRANIKKDLFFLKYDFLVHDIKVGTAAPGLPLYTRTRWEAKQNLFPLSNLVLPSVAIV